MDRAKEFVEAFLQHYSSDFYDPAKAHEYYLRTRELKGRRSAGKLKGADKKEAWATAKQNLNEAKRSEITSAADERQAIVEKARATATEKRQQISDKLANLMKAISEGQSRTAGMLAIQRRVRLQSLAKRHKKEMKKISDEASSKIAALPPIPKGISKEERAKLAAKRSEEIAKIRGDATKKSTSLADQTGKMRDAIVSDIQKKRADLSTDVGARRQSGREGSAKQREAVGNELKATIDNARTRYKALRESLIAQYEEKSQQTFESIKQG